MSTTTTKLTLHEDWAVVILGSLIIILSLAGLLLPVPTFGWKKGADLTGTVLGSANLVKMLLQFVFVAIIGGIGAFITGKSVKNYALGFPLVYVVTILALVLAGSSQAKSLNLEAVIFSLVLGLLISNFIKLPEWLKSSRQPSCLLK